jgi:non-ribosomal peptide synthetase component F
LGKSSGSELTSGSEHGFTNLGDLIRRDRDLSKTAVIDLGGETSPREFSYAQLDAMADGVARALGRRGLVRGDRVAILSANRAEYLAAYYGIMRAGLVAVPVNFKFPRATIHFILQDSGAKLLFCDRARLPDCPDGLPVVCFGGSSLPSPGGGGSASAASRGGVSLSLPHEDSPPPDALRASTSPFQRRGFLAARAYSTSTSLNLL